MHQSKIILIINDTQEGLHQVEVNATRFTIGSSLDNDLVIDATGLSRRHALIETYEEIVQISDCGSEEGTFVNGKQITSGVTLRNKDRILLGSDCTIQVNISSTPAKSAAVEYQDQGEQSVLHDGSQPLQSNDSPNKIATPI